MNEANIMKTTEQFIKDARKVHGDKYNYSKVEYTSSKEKVCIVCPEHGEFWQTPNNHLRGQNCPKCINEKLSKDRRSSKNDFITRAIKIHGDKYNYSKVEYVNNHTKVCIICPIHGEFWQEPSMHLSGQGCRKCYNDKVSINQTLSKEEFIKKSKDIHGNKYNYSKVNYVHSKQKVCIICPRHGEFWQKPNSHLRGCGCSKCHNSKLEDKVSRYLESESIEFIQGAHFEWLGKQHLDFYLPQYKIAIECQGGQHFKPVKRFGGYNKFKKVVELDKIKKLVCEKNNIKIIYFTDVKDESAKDMIHNINEIKEKIINYECNKN